MERTVDLDQAAAEITSRRPRWERLGVNVGPTTWRDEHAAWPQPFETDRSVVGDTDSVGVRLTLGDEREVAFVLFRGGWVDVLGYDGTEPTVDAPDVATGSAFADLLDSQVLRFLNVHT